MEDFEGLMSVMSRQELALLCQLNSIVGREMLVTCNIYRLLNEGLVRVCEPLVRPTGEPQPFLHSYKLTSRGVKFLAWVRGEASRRSHVGF